MLGNQLVSDECKGGAPALADLVTRSLKPVTALVTGHRTNASFTLMSDKWSDLSKPEGRGRSQMAFGRSPQPVDVFIVDADPSQRRALAGMIAERALGRFQAHACASEAEALAARGGGDNDAIVIADLETIGGTARLADFAAGEYPLIATSVSEIADHGGCRDEGRRRSISCRSRSAPRR